MQARVRGLFIFRERGQPGEPVKEALFREGKAWRAIAMRTADPARLRFWQGRPGTG